MRYVEDRQKGKIIASRITDKGLGVVINGIMDRRTTFGLILAFCLAGAAEAQVIGKLMSAAALPACNSVKNFGVVNDATNATTLGAGGGTAWVDVSCATGSWAIEEHAAVADLSAYLPVSGTTAAAIVVQGSGAGNDVSAISADDIFLTPADALVAVAGGNTTITSTAGTVAIASSAGAVTVTAVGATNDVTLTAADDVILAPTDALTGTVGGAIALTTTAGAIGLTAGGTTQDITLTSVDDVILSPTDALTAVAGGAVTLTGTVGTVAIAASAGAVTVTAVGATNDVSLVAADDVILSPTDDLTLNATDDTTIAGDTLTVSNTTVSVNPGGSTAELTVVAGSARAGVAFGIPSSADLPTCDSTIAPAGTTALIWDTTGPDLCACPEGVDWIAIDGSGTCV